MLARTILTTFGLVTTLLFVCDSNAKAQSPGNGTTTMFFARSGESLDSPHVETYHYVELLQLRGKWTIPDLGYIDFGHRNYQELFLGAGRTLLDSKRATLIEELYFVQAVGSAAESARYLWPWTMLQLRLTTKLTSETLYFPYIPLNASGRIQHVLERSKLEYGIHKDWKIGAGYAGYKFANLPWQQMPFIATTISTRVGAFELWLQKRQNGGQIQLRYALIHSSH